MYLIGSGHACELIWIFIQRETSKSEAVQYRWDGRMIISFEHVDTVSIAFKFTADRAKICTHNLKVVVTEVP